MGSHSMPTLPSTNDLAGTWDRLIGNVQETRVPTAIVLNIPLRRSSRGMV